MIDHILSYITFLPVLGALLVLCVPSNRKELMKWVALLGSLPSLILSSYLIYLFDWSKADFQFVEKVLWIPSFNIYYHMGIDGLSIPMVFLTTLLTTICIIASWNIERGLKAYLVLFLLLETGMLGVFEALDFFLFYVFWEVGLFPMYFIIGIWGGPRKEYAAIKFFLYTLFGSVFMLLVILYLYFTSDPHTFDLPSLMKIAGNFPLRTQLILFAGLYIAFAIKVPVFPFHTWLPDAHVEAPTAGSVILAGILLKMGTYGLLRFNYQMLPDATCHAAYFLAVMGTINIVYGAFVAMAQVDFKKLVAYSSISHMGYVLLGISSLTEQGIVGGSMQMFNHGVITAMLFLIVGVIYDRAHHRDLDRFGGLASVMPVYAGVTSIAFFAAMGLPGLNAFISEVLTFLGAFKVYRLLTIISATGVILTAGYVLWTLERVFLGPLKNEEYRKLPEITPRELLCLVPLALIVIFLGVYPNPLINIMKETLNEIRIAVIGY